MICENSPMLNNNLEDSSENVLIDIVSPIFCEVREKRTPSGWRDIIQEITLIIHFVTIL